MPYLARRKRNTTGIGSFPHKIPLKQNISPRGSESVVQKATFTLVCTRKLIEPRIRSMLEGTCTLIMSVFAGES